MVYSAWTKYLVPLARILSGTSCQRVCILKLGWNGCPNSVPGWSLQQQQQQKREKSTGHPKKGAWGAEKRRSMWNWKSFFSSLVFASRVGGENYTIWRCYPTFSHPSSPSRPLSIFISLTHSSSHSYSHAHICSIQKYLSFTFWVSKSFVLSLIQKFWHFPSNRHFCFNITHDDLMEWREVKKFIKHHHTS